MAAEGAVHLHTPGRDGLRTAGQTPGTRGMLESFPALCFQFRLCTDLDAAAASEDFEYDREKLVPRRCLDVVPWIKHCLFGYVAEQDLVALAGAQHTPGVPRLMCLRGKMPEKGLTLVAEQEGSMSFAQAVFSLLWGKDLYPYFFLIR